MGIDQSLCVSATHKGENGDLYKKTGGTWFKFIASDGVMTMDHWSICESLPDILSRTKGKPTPDWSTAPEWATHALTTGPEWEHDYDKGVIQFAMNKEGKYWQGEDSFVSFIIGNEDWIILEKRPKDNVKVTVVNRTNNNQMRDYQFSAHNDNNVAEGKSPSAHYDKYIYRVHVTQDDADNGYKDVKLDPYRVGKVCGVGGGALEQCLKKSMRGTDKGHSERRVLEEIISAAQRGIAMLDEDGK